MAHDVEANHTYTIHTLLTGNGWLTVINQFASLGNATEITCAGSLARMPPPVVTMGGLGNAVSIRNSEAVQYRYKLSPTVG